VPRLSGFVPAELDGVYAPGAYQDAIRYAELLSIDIDYARFDFFGPDPAFMRAKSPPIPRLATVRGSPLQICSGGNGTYDPPGSCKQASTDGVHAIKPYCWSIWTAFAPRPSRSPLPEVRHPHSRLANKLTITHNTVIFNNGLRFSRFYSKNSPINNDLAGVFDLVLKLVFQNNTVGKFFIVYG